MAEPIFKVSGLRKRFGRPGLLGGGRVVDALQDVAFTVPEGASLGVVGESGSGKSTLARILVGLEHMTEGTVAFQGRPLLQELKYPKTYYKEVQFVFQNSYAAFNPRRRMETQLDVHLRFLSDLDKSARRERIRWALEVAQLSPDLLDRYPHSFSGGQIQRFSIARSLLGNPRVLVMDEAVSALDVSVQARVLRLLRDLHRELGFTLIFITHDLSVVDYLCDSVIVMSDGRVVESGPTVRILRKPETEYTRQLLAACLTA